MRLVLALLALPLMAAAAASDCEIDGFTVSSIGGAPVPRANISLVGGKSAVITKADDNGRWHFANVACGLATVMGARAGFLQDVVVRGALYKKIELTSGSPVHDYKLEMIPQVAVTGKVTDERGDPLSVNITAMTTPVVEGRRLAQNVGGTMSNDIGEFRLAGFKAGRYTFCANPGGVPDASGIAIAQSCYPPLDLAAGSEVRVNFSLGTTSTVHIRGALSGVPAGVRPSVTLMPVSPAMFSFHHPVELTPDGRFNISGVRPGSYILNADTNTGGHDDFYARMPLEVGSADMDNLVLRLEPTFELPVTIKVESKNGNVLKDSIRPMARRSTEWGSTAFRVSRFTMTQSIVTGFVIGSVTPGPLTLYGAAPAPFYLKSALYNGQDMANGEVMVSGPAPIELVLSDDGGIFEGEVDDSDGKPAAQCDVTLMRNGRARNVFTDDNGHFKMTTVAPGDYIAYAWTDFTQAEYANPEWLRKYTGVPITISAGQTSTLKLKLQAIQP